MQEREIDILDIGTHKSGNPLSMASRIYIASRDTGLAELCVITDKIEIDKDDPVLNSVIDAACESSESLPFTLVLVGFNMATINVKEKK